MLWVDKYRPQDLDSLDFHAETSSKLKQLAEVRDFPHLLFYGPSGAGKKTCVMAFLRATYGDSALHLKLEHKTLNVTESKTIEIASLSSPHHIDINPSDAGPTYDRVVIMQTIREIASTAPLLTGKKANSHIPPFKVVVLNEVNKMSRGAQQALRRTMEKYVNTCRLILLCNSTSRLIPPLKSRCLGIRFPAPPFEQLKAAVSSVAANEGLGNVSEAFARTLATQSESNARRALLMAESAKAAGVSFQSDGSGIPIQDWKACILNIAHDIMTEQTPKQLFECRAKFYELLAHCIPAETILRDLVKALLAEVDPSLRSQVLAYAGQFDHSLKQGSKPIMHLEAFTANVMKAIKMNH